MRESICFWIVRELDGLAELTIELRSDDFSGRGSAYFDLGLLLEKAKEFSSYPLRGGGVTLAGGFLDKNDLSKLRQEHVRVFARTIGQSGRIGLWILLAEPSDDGQEIRRCISAEIDTEYSQLSALSEGLAALAEGRSDSFSIEFHD
jgi:hypothetical protein